jgi:hypothetical protein
VKILGIAADETHGVWNGDAWNGDACGELTQRQMPAFAKWRNSGLENQDWTGGNTGDLR